MPYQTNRNSKPNSDQLGAYLVDPQGNPILNIDYRALASEVKGFDGAIDGDLGWSSFGGGGGLLGPAGAGQLNVGLSRFRSTGEFMGAYVADDTVHACVQIRAETLASLDWQLKDEDTGVVVEESNNRPDFGPGRRGQMAYKRWKALDKVLRNPNPFQNWNDFVQLQSLYYDLGGNMLGYLDNVNYYGQPEFIWPLNPAWTQPIIDPNEGLTEYLYQAGSTMLRCEPDEMMHGKKANPGTMFWGLSEIAVLAGVLDAQVGIDEYQRAFFANGAVLSGVVKADKSVDAKQYKLLKHELKENFQGVRNHWRVALLTGGMEWQNVSLSQNEMGMKDWKELGSERIRMLYRVPKSKLGRQDDAQYSKLDAADSTFYKESITPLAEVFQRAINEKLAKRYGFVFEFIIPQFEDLNSKMDIALKIDGLSSITTSEKRKSIKKLLGKNLILDDTADLKALDDQSSARVMQLLRLLVAGGMNPKQLPGRTDD